MPMVVISDAIGIEFFFRSGARAALSTRISRMPVRIIASAMAKNKPN